MLVSIPTPTCAEEDFKPGELARIMQGRVFFCERDKEWKLEVPDNRIRKD